MAKDFAKELCRRFVISRDKFHVSIVSYSQYVHIMPKFSDYCDEKSLENALDKQHLYEASSTSTGRTLKVINFDVFNDMKGGVRIKELGEQFFIVLSFNLTAVFALQSFTYVMQTKFSKIRLKKANFRFKQNIGKISLFFRVSIIYISVKFLKRMFTVV